MRTSILNVRVIGDSRINTLLYWSHFVRQLEKIIGIITEITDFFYHNKEKDCDPIKLEICKVASLTFMEIAICSNERYRHLQLL